MTAAARQPVDGARRAMLAKVHLGAKELGLDEDTRRDLLSRLTGHRSSADCTDAQLAAVLAEYRRQGWKPSTSRQPAVGATRAPRTSQTAAQHPVAKKARAMWISLHQLGVVRDPSERALEAFAKRQLGVDRMQWADQAKGYRLIEALKKMAERAGWSQDVAGLQAERVVWSLKARLVNAQRELIGLGFLAGIAGYTEADLDRIAREQAAVLHETTGLPE